MFCQYCGCMLKGGEMFCPECGRPLTEEAERKLARDGTTKEVPLGVYLAFFAIGFIIMFHLTFFFRFSFFVFIIPMLFLNGGRSKFGAVALGLTAGTVVGLCCHFLL